MILPAPDGRITAALGLWYRRHHRDLPWRRTRDPWAIWVAEVMLQQTTVATARSRWERFLTRFPTVASVAAASVDEVLAEWGGLGYYARARNLHQAARKVADSGVFPRTAGEWRRLPGVGAYTSAAVASLAFGEGAAVVDTNVARVLARLSALPLDLRSPRGAAELGAAAAGLLPDRAPGDHNQAIMELGATVCTPRAPRCPACPLRSWCRAHLCGRPDDYPAPSRRPPVCRIEMAAGAAFRSGRLVLARDHEFVEGHWSLPAVVVESADLAAGRLRMAWGALAGRNVARIEAAGRLAHSVLDRRYVVHLFLVEEEPRERAGPPRVTTRNIRASDLSCLPHGGLLRKALPLIGRRPRRGRP